MGAFAGGGGGEDLGPAVDAGQGVLELGGAAAVPGDRGPLVVPDHHLGRAEGEHGLDGEGHTLGQGGVGEAVVVVGDLQAGVELGAHPVADELPHHPQAGAAGAGLDGPADGRYRRPRPHRLDPGVERGPGLDHQPPGVLVHVAHHHRDRGVAVNFLAVHGDVDVDDVAVGQLAGVGDAVADHLVHRGAHRLGEPPVAERARVGAGHHRRVMHEAVQRIGGDPRRRPLAGSDEYLRGQRPGAGHGLQLRRGAHRRRSRAAGFPRGGQGVGGPVDPPGNRPAGADQAGPHRRVRRWNAGRARRHCRPPLALSHSRSQPRLRSPVLFGSSRAHARSIDRAPAGMLQRVRGASRLGMLRRGRAQPRPRLVIHRAWRGELGHDSRVGLRAGTG